MILGNGMIAKALKQYKKDDTVILFASGVSNSKENDDSEFEREFELLKSLKGSNKKLIYFSTCSIFDESLFDSKYIIFKLKIEKFIKNNFSKYIIFRLPNITGKTKNKNTSFNYFKNKILKKEIIRIQSDASRYIIDIDDLSKILPMFISSSLYEKDIINVCFDNKMKAIEIVHMIEEILGISTKKQFIEGGRDYNIDNKEFIKMLKSHRYELDRNYNFNILKKHLA